MNIVGQAPATGQIEAIATFTQAEAFSQSPQRIHGKRKTNGGPLIFLDPAIKRTRHPSSSSTGTNSSEVKEDDDRGTTDTNSDRTDADADSDAGFSMAEISSTETLTEGPLSTFRESVHAEDYPGSEWNKVTYVKKKKDAQTRRA